MKIDIQRPDGIKSNHFFVYCDLKNRGKQNHLLLSNGCRLIGGGILYCFQMYDVLRSYPVIIPTYSLKNSVLGEVWSIGHPKLLDSLDPIKSPMGRNIFEVDVKKRKEWCWTYYMPASAFNEDAPGVKKNKEGKWKV